MRNKRFTVIGLCVVAAGVVAGGVGSSVFNFGLPTTVRHSHPKAAQYARTTATHSRSLEQLPPAAPQALAQLVQRLGDHRVLRSEIGGPPAGWRYQDDSNSSVPNEVKSFVWPHLTVAGMRDNVAANMRAIWEGSLVVGALRDSVHERGAGRVFGGVIDVAFPDGSIATDVGGGVGNIVYDQVFNNDSAATVAADITAKAKALGLSVDSLDVMNVDQPAPALVVTGDPSALPDPDSLVRALFGDHQYEGEYLEVRDTSGATALVEASSFRTGAGSTWFSPTHYPDRQPSGLGQP